MWIIIISLLKEINFIRIRQFTFSKVQEKNKRYPPLPLKQKVLIN
jgi:hypothetical protein